jgi:RNA-directed DNA polymerase
VTRATTPQGGVASPLLANLFLHYASDEWIKRNYPNVPFERYADDAIVHCRSEEQAKSLKTEIGRRLLQCRLELHPEKTKIVYCKDGQRQGSYQHESFDFLGYTFRPRTSKSRSGNYFVNFSPAVSNKASVTIRGVMRSWLFHRRSDKSLEDLARLCNPVLRGWINYYGQYYRSALYPIFDVFNRILVRCMRRKYKRFRFNNRRATRWLRQISCQQPSLFPTGRLGFNLRLDDRSRITGDRYVRIWESARVRFPRATRPWLTDRNLTTWRACRIHRSSHVKAA